MKHNFHNLKWTICSTFFNYSKSNDKSFSFLVNIDSILATHEGSINGRNQWAKRNNKLARSHLMPSQLHYFPQSCFKDNVFKYQRREMWKIQIELIIEEKAHHNEVLLPHPFILFTKGISTLFAPGFLFMRFSFSSALCDTENSVLLMPYHMYISPPYIFPEAYKMIFKSLSNDTIRLICLQDRREQEFEFRENICIIELKL